MESNLYIIAEQLSDFATITIKMVWLEVKFMIIFIITSNVVDKTT